MGKYLNAAILAITLTLSPSRGAVTGFGGLEAVAVSADGKLVAVGGQNRVVYLVDAETLTVKQRFWLGTRIGNLAFSRNGSRLAVEDEIDQVRLLDLASGKELAKLANVSGMVQSPSGNVVALRDSKDLTNPLIRIVSLDDLSEKGKIGLPEAASACTFSADGKRLIVLSRSVRGDEKIVPAKETPRDLRGLARAEYQQMHDGYDSYLRTFEIETGKLLERVRLWYTSDSDSTLLVQDGETTHILNRGNVCAHVGAHGKVTLFATSQRINHGLGSSRDGKLLLTGGLAEGSYGPFDDTKRKKFEIDELPGQAEFLARFVVRNDGGCFAVTTSYRLVRITRDGKVDKVAAIY